MSGGNLAAGIGILGALAGLLFLVELIEDGTTRDAPDSSLSCSPDCGSNFDNNFDIGEIDGAPSVVNGIYTFLLGTTLATGLVLFVAGLVGVPLGGG